MFKIITAITNKIFAVSEDTPLALHRNKIFFPVSIIGILTVLPYGIYHLFFGKILMGLTLMFACAILTGNAWSIYKKTKPIIPVELLILPQMFGINYIIYNYGVPASFWTFQSLLVFYFFYSRWFANICTIILCAFATTAVYQVSDTPTAIRFFTSVLTTSLGMNFIVKVLEDLHSRLLEENVRDPLTGAYNRRHLNDKLQEAISRKMRRNVKTSILLFDLDHFKKINDTLGHTKGDEILKKFVSLVQENTRRFDLIFRLGGEEFLLFLPDAEEENAIRIGNKICQTMKLNPIEVDFPVTVTIGVSEVKKDDTIESWLNSADEALYHGKKTGRNKIIKREFGEPLQVPIVTNIA